MLATVFAYAGRFDEAQDQARTVLDIEPSYVPAYWALALARDAQRQYDEALTACTRGLAYAKDDTVLLAESARALAKLGRGDEAERVLDRLLNRRRNEYFSAVLIAGVYDGLGREDETFEWLERACEDRDGLCPTLNQPGVWGWGVRRADPRFQALLRRMNFPETATTAYALPETASS